MYNSNHKPLSFAPAGGFPVQRISDFGNVINPVAYINSPISQEPTTEHEYHSIVDRARKHLAFGESRTDRRRITIGERIAQLKKDDIGLPESGVSGFSYRHDVRFRKLFSKRRPFPFSIMGTAVRR